MTTNPLKSMAGMTGLEPATFGVTGSRSTPVNARLISLFKALCQELFSVISSKLHLIHGSSSHFRHISLFPLSGECS